MVAAVRVHKTGGPEVLTYEDIRRRRRRAPARSKSRTMPAASTSSTPISAAASIRRRSECRSSPATRARARSSRSAPGSREFKVGDRVGYVSALGSYAAERVMPADRAVKLPDKISYEQAAAMMLKGMTVEYLLQPDLQGAEGHDTCSSMRPPAASA